MRRFLVSASIGIAGVIAHGAGTVTFNISSPNNGTTVSSAELIEWTITISVSSGDNLGLALAAVDLVQDAANPASFDLPAGEAPLHMTDFDRPAKRADDGRRAHGYTRSMKKRPVVDLPFDSSRSRR